MTYSFFEALDEALVRNYFNYKGRSPRSEYWWYSIFINIIFIIVSLVDIIINPELVEKNGVGVLCIITLLATIIPSITLGIRRLHDVGRSGWWSLIAFTIIGLIPLIYWGGFKRSDPHTNRFGAPPQKPATALPA